MIVACVVREMHEEGVVCTSAGIYIASEHLE